LTWLAGLLGFLVLATAFFLNASRPTYACTEQFNPTPAPSFVPPTPAPSRAPSTATPVPATATPAPPTPVATPAAAGSASPSAASPAPSASASPPTTPATAAPVTAPPPGYVQMDGGAGHVDTGTTVRYPSCPPASGKHYNGAGVGPIRAGFYGLNDQAPPPGWVHNLEHGYTVLLYRCATPGTDQPAEACTDAGQAALRDIVTRWPNTPYCDTPPGTFNPVIARFDEMAWPYAVLVWDVILPLRTLDEAAIFDFQAQRGERFNPEVAPGCVDPTPTPGPATPTPIVSPAPSDVASPGASLAASPAASPATSAAASTAPASS
jgi:hypothetical protein